jgi:ABC-2 type transport system ATP-binding protein
MSPDFAIRTEALRKVVPVGFWGRPTTILDHVTLDVRPGEVFGFLGPNGAGKTTTIKILVGLIYRTSGRAEVLGYEAGDVRGRRRLGFLPEIPHFPDYLSAEEFLRFYGRLSGLRYPSLESRVGQMMEMVGLVEVRRQRLHRFSKGMLQRIGIAQALLNDPDLIILDEPMSGLDPQGRKEMRDLILRLKHQNKTVFFSSHQLQEVELVCDRIGILSQGRMVAAGGVPDLLGAWCTQHIEMVVEHLDAEGVDLARKIVQHVTMQGDRVVLTVPAQRDVDELLDLIRSRRASLVTLTTHKKSLETLYLEHFAASPKETLP